MKTQVKMTFNALGEGSMKLVDRDIPDDEGTELAHLVGAGGWSITPGKDLEPVQVTLTLLPGDFELVGTANVQLSEHMAMLLKLLGWTPPVDQVVLKSRFEQNVERVHEAMRSFGLSSEDLEQVRAVGEPRGPVVIEAKNFTAHRKGADRRQCSRRDVHSAHSYQAEFGAYVDTLCPGNDGSSE